MSDGSQKKRASFQNAGRKMDRALGEAAERLDREAERLVAYLNDEVVPSVRQRSSRGLRLAAERLAHFADYLDSTKKR